MNYKYSLSKILLEIILTHKISNKTEIICEAIEVVNKKEN